MEHSEEINELKSNLQNNLSKTQLNPISHLPMKSFDSNHVHDSKFQMPSNLNKTTIIFQSAQKSQRETLGYSERYKHLLLTTDSKKIYQLNQFIPSNIPLLSNGLSSKKAPTSCKTSVSNFFLGKKTLRSSEDILLEKIIQSKTEAQNAIKNNQEYYYKTNRKLNTPSMDIVSTKPLTLIKPFHLSSNNCSEYLKKRMISTPNGINEINQKIKYKLAKKCDKNYNQMKENIPSISNYDNGSHYDQLINNIEVSDIKVDIEPNKSLINDNINNMSLSERINHYCEISARLLQSQKEQEQEERRQKEDNIREESLEKYLLEEI